MFRTAGSRGRPIRRAAKSGLAWSRFPSPPPPDVEGEHSADHLSAFLQLRLTTPVVLLSYQVSSESECTNGVQNPNNPNLPIIRVHFIFVIEPNK